MVGDGASQVHGFDPQPRASHYDGLIIIDWGCSQLIVGVNDSGSSEAMMLLHNDSSFC